MIKYGFPSSSFLDINYFMSRFTYEYTSFHKEDNNPITCMRLRGYSAITRSSNYCSILKTWR
jgi:hypothetical protein